MATSYQDDYMKTALRLPRTLHAKIQEAATATGKSLNSELIARLERSFASEDLASSEALMLEMRRTQLLLRRAQVQADASRAFFTGTPDAKKERAHRVANPDPSDVEEAKRGAQDAKLKASHLRQELFGIDGRLLEIEGRLQDLGYSLEFVTKDHPAGQRELVLNKPTAKSRKPKA